MALRELHLFAGATMKKCGGCNETLPLSGFYSNKSQTDGRASRCKKCACAYQKNKYDSNPEAQRLRQRNYLARYSKEHNERRRANRREIYIAESSRRYGIGQDELRSMLSREDCAICGRTVSFDSENVHEKPNIDHCHATGKVRGILCGYCNSMLGRCSDSTEILHKAIKYLESAEVSCGIS